MNIQPTDIEKYFNEKGKRGNDDIGWTGMYNVSAKDILDFLIDLAPPTQETQEDSHEFLKYTAEARNKFCTHINSLDWNTKLRTACEDLLICFDQMKERISRQSLPVNKGGEWISVEDRLPEKQEKVLCITNYGGMDVCRYTGELWLNDMRAQHSNGGVTHWQPLPEPTHYINNKK